MVPDKTNPKWTSLVKGDIVPEMNMLALKVMLKSLSNQYRINKDNTVLVDSAEKLHDFFSKYESVLQKEIKTIFG
jgi:hypothetical protein